MRPSPIRNEFDVHECRRLGQMIVRSNSLLHGLGELSLKRVNREASLNKGNLHT